MQEEEAERALAPETMCEEEERLRHEREQDAGVSPVGAAAGGQGRGATCHHATLSDHGAGQLKPSGPPTPPACGPTLQQLCCAPSPAQADVPLASVKEVS